MYQRGPRTILKEIEDIKAGKWDAQIKSNLTGQEPAGEESPPVDERVFNVSRLIRPLDYFLTLCPADCACRFWR